MSEATPTLLEYLSQSAIIIASITAIYGINAWRREYRGKKDIDLAEETLALFYKAKDAISAIRNRMIALPLQNIFPVLLLKNCRSLQAN